MAFTSPDQEGIYPTTLNCARENRELIRNTQDRMPVLIHRIVFIVYGFFKEMAVTIQRCRVGESLVPSGRVLLMNSGQLSCKSVNYIFPSFSVATFFSFLATKLTAGKMY
jgi:hypothetical protein